MRSAVVLAIVLVTSSARAQPGAMPSPQPPPPDDVSETTALALSLGGTLASYAAVTFAAAVHTSASSTIGTIGVFGVLGAPTAGHWYSGRIVTRGLGLRGAGIVVLLVGAIADSEGCSLVYGGDAVSEEPDDCGDNFRTKKGTALMIAGAALFLGGTLDDIITAPGAARRRNAQHRANLTLAPLVHHDGGGLALAGTF
jgi:hypothetical protein